MKIIIFLLLFSSSVYSENMLIDKCKDGDALSCRTIASYLENNLGEKFIALKYYIDACDKGDGFSCNHSANGYFLIGEPELGLKTFEKACKLKHYPSCGLIGAIYLKGDLVKANIRLGYNFMEKACIDGKMEEACEIVSLIKREKELESQIDNF